MESGVKYDRRPSATVGRCPAGSERSLPQLPPHTFPNGGKYLELGAHRAVDRHVNCSHPAVSYRLLLALYAEVAPRSPAWPTRQLTAIYFGAAAPR